MASGTMTRVNSHVSHAGTHDQSGVEGGGLSEKAPGKKIDHQDQAGDGKHQGQPGLEGALPEKLVADGDHPVMQRGFFEIANAVLIHHDPVAALQHLAGDQRVRGVGVVEQRRLSGGGDVNSERQNEQGEDGESAIHLVVESFLPFSMPDGSRGWSAYDEGVIIALGWGDAALRARLVQSGHSCPSLSVYAVVGRDPKAKTTPTSRRRTVSARHFKSQGGVDFEVLGFYHRVVGVALIVFGPVLGQVGGQGFLAGFVEAGKCGLGGAKYFRKKATASEGGKG